MSAISEACRQFQRMLNLSEKGNKKQNLKKRLLKSFGNELPFFQRTPGSSELVHGTKDCNDKSLRTKESTIKDVARELRAFIEELETTSVWPTDREDISKVISRYLNCYSYSYETYLLLNQQCPNKFIDLSNP